MNDVMGDVVERVAGGETTETAETSASAAARPTGFPEVKHRSETNFGKRSRFAARKAAMRAKEAAGTSAGEAASEPAPVRKITVDPEKEDAKAYKRRTRGYWLRCRSRR